MKRDELIEIIDRRQSDIEPRIVCILLLKDLVRFGDG